MAAQLMTEIQQDFLTCALCLKPYQNPKALPCLHSFCTLCLSNHLLSSSVKPSGDRKTRCIFCPVCRQVSDVPKTGVAGFQDNHLLKNLLDMIYGPRGFLQPCDMCHEEGKQTGAGHCCIKCEDFLCDDCAAVHKRTRITKDHLVINVSMMKDVCMNRKSPDKKIVVRLLMKLGSYGPDLMNPTAITTNQADDIIVSNNNNGITIFAHSGEVKKQIDQRAFYGSEENSLPNRGVAVTTEGYLAVAMRRDVVGSNAQLGVVETLAARQAGIFSIKTRSGTNCIPHGIATTPDNYTIITDVGKHCFYIFNPEMVEIKQVGKRGSKNSQFKSPFFVTINRKREILVSDYDNHCIKVFDLKGKYLRQFGSMGRKQGELMHPMGLCTDSDDHVFVCDRDNHRVQMFSPDGSFITIICHNTCRDGNDVRPQDVAMTTRGHLVVLVKGVEGVNVAEMHVLQIGARFGDEDDVPQVKEATRHIAKLRQSLEFLKTPTRKGSALPPITGKSVQPSAPPPDLLGPSFGGKPFDGTRVGVRDMDNSGARAGTNDFNSSVCTIL